MSTILGLSSWTRREIRQYVGRKLGEPKIRVNLEDDDYTDAMEDALRLYNRHFPYYQYSQLSISGDGAYTIPASPRIIDVVKVDILTVDSGTVAFSLGEPVLLDSLLPIAKYSETISMLKATKRWLSALEDWVYDKRTRKIMLYRVPPGVTLVGVTKLVSSELEEVAEDRQDSFLKYTVAQCKIRIGNALGKFNVPAPNGGNLTDWAKDLKVEGKEEAKEVEEDWYSSQTSAPPIIN